MLACECYSILFRQKIFFPLNEISRNCCSSCHPKRRREKIMLCLLRFPNNIDEPDCKSKRAIPNSHYSSQEVRLIREVVSPSLFNHHHYHSHGHVARKFVPKIKTVATRVLMEENWRRYVIIYNAM